MEARRELQRLPVRAGTLVQDRGETEAEGRGWRLTEVHFYEATRTEDHRPKNFAQPQQMRRALG